MIRVLIVDDERLARAELNRLLSAHPDVEIVGEASNGVEALALFEETKPDLLLLDIQMPGIDGLAVATQVASRAQVVFCTAFENFAVDAFGLNAVDYLLKPVATERLAASLQRFREQQTQVEPLPYDHRVLLQFGEVARIVRLCEIDRFHAVANYVQVFTQFGKTFLQTSLSHVEKRLHPTQFFRVSRADIVRLDAIQSIEPDVGTNFIAKMRDLSEVRVSRRQAQELRARLGTFG